MYYIWFITYPAFWMHALLGQRSSLIYTCVSSPQNPHLSCSKQLNKFLQRILERKSKTQKIEKRVCRKPNQLLKIHTKCSALFPTQPGYFKELVYLEARGTEFYGNYFLNSPLGGKKNSSRENIPTKLDNLKSRSIRQNSSLSLVTVPFVREHTWTGRCGDLRETRQGKQQIEASPFVLCGKKIYVAVPTSNQQIQVWVDANKWLDVEN